MSWTQPQCADCWDQENPSRPAARLKEPFRESETCCTCGKGTQDGIYVRKDPKTVKFPSE